jgi:SAM-dependent methyltransferase
MAVSDFAESYSLEAALGFPLMPSEHSRAWRYIFDWAVAGDALNCCPGDLVLEFGAGPGFASELFNRLGYRTVALDLDPVILGFARQRWAADRRLDVRRAHFVAGDGMRLPFADASFDGIICLNALHHMSDYEATLAEMRRILKPGARAAFGEPGRTHADTPEAKLARERGATERSVHLDEIEALARRVGFARLLLKPYPYPFLVELDYNDFRRYRLHLGRSPFTQPDQIGRYLVEQHLLFVLEAPGVRPVTSAGARGFGALGAAITVEGLASAAQPMEEIRIRARLRNTGHCVWLGAVREFGGYVTLGTKLCTPDGRVVLDNFSRMHLPHDVAPGETVEVEHSLTLPWAEPGAYQLKFDMVSEQVAWFEYYGSPTVTYPLIFAPRVATSRHPRTLRARLAVTGVPAQAARGDTIALDVQAENSGDTVWLSAPDGQGGEVTAGFKLVDGAGVIVSDSLGRTPLPRDIAPGEQVELRCAVTLPADLAAGLYVLRADMVHERIAWFEHYGSPVVEHRIAVDSRA